MSSERSRAATSGVLHGVCWEPPVLETGDFRTPLVESVALSAPRGLCSHVTRVSSGRWSRSDRCLVGGCRPPRALAQAQLALRSRSASHALPDPSSVNAMARRGCARAARRCGRAAFRGHPVARRRRCARRGRYRRARATPTRCDGRTYRRGPDRRSAGPPWVRRGTVVDHRRMRPLACAISTTATRPPGSR